VLIKQNRDQFAIIMAHYSEKEKMLLAQLISEEKAIENKKTGSTDLKEKTEAWERITKKIC